MACSHQLAGSALAGLQKAFVSECGVRVLSLASSSKTVLDVQKGREEPCWGEPSGGGLQTSCQHHQGSTVKPVLILAHKSHACNHAPCFTITLKLVLIFTQRQNSDHSTPLWLSSTHFQVSCDSRYLSPGHTISLAQIWGLIQFQWRTRSLRTVHVHSL